MDSEKVATGGTLTRVGLTSRLVHTFTESGTFTVHRPTLVQYLVVGGKGGGGLGGRGEVKRGSSVQRLQPGKYTVQVGKSGTYLRTETKTIQVDTLDPWCKMGPYDSRYPSGMQVTSCFDIPEDPITGRKVPAKKPLSVPIRVYSDGSASSFLENTARAGGAETVTPGYHRQYYSGPVYGNVGGAIRPWTDYPDPKSKAGTAYQEVTDDITGRNVSYGLTPMVIIMYDESQAGPVPTTTPPTTTPAPGPSQEEIDRVVKEYETKMAQLQAAAAAEKQALLDQNSTAAQQAQQLQQQLIGDLTVLKQQYDQLKAAAETTTGQLDQAKQELTQLKSEYTQKMSALQAAQAAELEALNAKNSAAVNEARAAQQQLIAEMTSLKSQYDAIVAKASECPTIPENAIVVDGKDGQLYKWHMAALRPMSSDTYRALGSPGYTTFPSGQLDRCPRGPVVVIETPPPTTPSPTSSPKDQTFPGTLYILVHAESWLKHQELKVLASRFGGATIEPFQYKSLEQVFVVNNNGYIRNLEGTGPYLASHDSCMAPVMMKETPEMGWKIQKAGDSKYAYRLVAHCGTSLTASTGAREPMLERPSTEQASDTWYILPVGSATF